MTPPALPFDAHPYADCDATAVKGSSRWRKDADHTTDGPTVCANWSAAPANAEVRQDRLGMIPLFWWSSVDRFVVSTSLLEVARRTGALELNWDAIAAFLALGNYLSEETPFQGIRTLPPGGTLVWAHGAPAKITRPTARVVTPFQGGRAEAKRIFAELFAKAVARRFPADLSKVVIPLSGGRDSRHIALECATQGRVPVNVLTIRAEFSANDEDVRVAALVAERIRCPHTIMEIDWDHYIEVERLKNIYTHFLVDVDHHALFEMSLSRHLQGARVFFGTCGDVLLGDAYFSAHTESLLQQGRLEEFADIEMGNYQAPVWFRDNTIVDRTHARHGLVSFLKTLPPSPNMFRDYVFAGRQVRNTALIPFDLILRRNEVATPFLDVDVLAFLHSLPADPFGPFGLHDEIIAETYPAFADIPYERKGLKEPPLAARRWKSVRSAWRNLWTDTPVLREHFSQLFMWPHFMRACLGRGVDDMWWLRQMIYLLDLIAFSKNPKAVYQASAARHALWHSAQGLSDNLHSTSDA